MEQALPTVISNKTSIVTTVLAAIGAAVSFVILAVLSFGADAEEIKT